MRYVLLKHEKDVDFHVDFLLDCGEERLLTWQICGEYLIEWLESEGKFFNLSKPPNPINGTIIPGCQRVFDHRRQYLNFSGDLGDGRGYVTRIETGEWQLLELDIRRLVIMTFGTRLMDDLPIVRRWQFEPPDEITSAPGEASCARLMQQLPSPGNANWHLAVCQCEKDMLTKFITD